MDINYWDDFYKKGTITNESSDFAKFIVKNYMPRNSMSIIELGCGNARDSLFFHECGMKVTAIDQVSHIDWLNEKYKNFQNLEFRKENFTKLGNNYTYDIVYSRFTLHSITEKEQNDVINWTYNYLNNDGIFCVEVRGQQNSLYKKGDRVPGQADAYYYENHYRRFLNFNLFCKELTMRGFKVIFSQEDRGFAPFEDADDIFIRVIVKK
jgi:tellurite methyltransferase